VLQVRLLDVLWLDVLAALGDDEGRGASGDIQVAVFVEVTKVPRTEPTVVGKDLFGLLGHVPIAGKDARPAGEDLSPFTDLVGLTLFLSLRPVGHGGGIQTDLDAGDGAADAAELRTFGRVQR
jgi:hypothetical protein